MTNKPHERGTYALYSRNHPRALQWRVDLDYVKQLSPEHRAWLARFIDGFYGGDYRGDEETPVSDKRTAYQAKNRAMRDLYTAPSVLVLSSEDVATAWTRAGMSRSEDYTLNLTSDPDLDLSPTPPYLDTPEYKSALASYRAQLDQGTKAIAPAPSPELDQADANLRSIVKKGTRGPT